MDKRKITYKGFFVGKGSLTDRIKKSIKNQAAGVFFKILILPLISFMFTFLLPILLVSSFIIFIILFSTTQQDYLIENTTKVNEPQYSQQKTIYTPYNTNGQAKSFNSFSTIPHGWPTSGTITQLYYSNFYMKSKRRIAYKGRPNIPWIVKGVKEFKKDPTNSDFAQIYTGGNWDKVGIHGGIDISNGLNTNIYSTAYGKVVAVGYSRKDWGKFMDIKAQNGNKWYLIRYAHLNKRLKKVGDIVYAGELVALMGSSGVVTGVHLHYSICENGESKGYCYGSSSSYTMLDPLPFALNYVYNGENIKISNQKEFDRKKVYSGVGKPGADLIDKNNLNLTNVNLDDKITPQIASIIQIKISEREDLHPLLIKLIHQRERSSRLTNPKAKNKDGFSGKNEGVYGIFSDFRALTPYCIRSADNFGKMDGQTITIRQFQNQTICATKVLKMKLGQSSQDITFFNENNFQVVGESNWKKICDGLKGYNGGPFYCYNNLYPKYSTNPTYRNMPVYVYNIREKRLVLLGYNKQDGIIKLLLDNWENFKIVMTQYKKNKDSTLNQAQ